MKNLWLFLFSLFLLTLVSSCVSKKEFLLLQKEVASLKDDTDGDGVLDFIDKEPNTREGCPVDTRGVTLDSDGDGVADCDDDERFSPPGYEVSSKGVADVPAPVILSEEDVNKMIDSRMPAAPPDELAALNMLNFPKFDIPPPPYSKIEKYPIRQLFPNTYSYRELDRQLDSLLRKAGFVKKGKKESRFYYYQITMGGQFRGYAVVTEFEKIGQDGVPKEDRFNLKVNKKKNKSFFDYVFPTRLNKGYFRFFAILITDDYFGNKSAGITKNELVDSLLTRGPKELPPIIKNQGIKSDAQVHFLVYEYRQLESQKDGHPTELENLSVEAHLKKAGIDIFPDN